MAKSKQRQKRYRKHVTFTLSDEARRTLEELAEDLGISKSAVVELVIRGKAAELGIELEQPKRKSPPGPRRKRKRG